MSVLTPAELASWLAEPDPAQRLPDGAGRAVLVDLTAEPGPVPALGAFAAVVIGVGGAATPFVDVVGDEGLAAAVDAAPLAATALALLLRGAGGLVAESTTYSMLQAGPEFAAWRSARAPRDRPPETDPVRVERVGDELAITLDRPRVRNALNTAMRDRLVEALGLAVVDPALRVVLRGAGPAFCAGGDLDEFGRRPDPVTAHLVRLARSPAALLDRVGDRVTAHLHGACYGAGIELPAFAARVVAAPDTRIALPELGLGLVPGAGGTVSLPRRIGRHRTMWLALTGTPIDAGTALAWGLVDAVDG
jgi:hypothetical protein